MGSENLPCGVSRIHGELFCLGSLNQPSAGMVRRRSGDLTIAGSLTDFRDTGSATQPRATSDGTAVTRCVYNEARTKQ
jgi:hypothetical protein